MARSEIFGGSVDVTYHTWMQCFDQISKFAMSRSEKESLLEVVFRRICDQIRTRNFEKESTIPWSTLYILQYIYNIENQNLLRRRASKEIADVEIILQLVSKFYQTQEKNKK